MAGNVTILDGGMGKELRRIGAPFRQPEWSALALLEAPEYVAKAHRNFIAAGAEIIITNTYGLVPFHIGNDRFESRGRELAQLAAEIARAAADEARVPVRVAGSLPPLFGSYQPESFRPADAGLMWASLIEPQAESVDLWVGETLSSTGEAQALIEAIAGSEFGGRLPIWLAFTLADHLVEDDGVEPRAVLRSRESMTDVAAFLQAADSSSEVEAILFNCSQPEVIAPAIRELGALLPRAMQLGAYANAFPLEALEDESYNANERIIERREDLTPARYAELGAEWVEAGATIIGGCCDIYPDHIAAMAAAVS